MLYVAVAFSAFMLFPAMGQSSDMADLLPRPACAEGWSMDEAPLLYTADTLYERINGEAELFVPYGFKMLAYGRYVSRKDPKVAIDADIYRMGSLLDAFGVFSNYRRSDGTDLKIGADGVVSSSQLLFYQDLFFVRLQVTGTTDPEPGSLMECARAVSARLPQNSSRPEVLDLFVSPAIVRNSEKYVAQSLFGYIFFRRGLTSDVVAGGEGFKVFIVLEDSPEAAGKALDLYAAYLRESGKEVALNGKFGRQILSAADPLYGKILIARNGKYLVGAMRFQDISLAEAVIESLLKRLATAGFSESG